MGHQLLFLTMLIAQPGDDPAAFIDRELAKGWQSQKLTPADKTGDLEFLRRASLDLIGRIPTSQEQADYQKDAPDNRRRLLVDRLLKHEDYAHNWANIWSDWMLGAAGDAKMRQAFHGWLEQHFARNGSHKELAEKLLTAKGATRDNPAVHFFVQLRGEATPEKEVEKYGQYDMFPITGHALRVFHGYRLQCVQCHDNAYDENSFQAHFFGINAMFRQVEFKGKKGNEGIDDNPRYNTIGFVPYERRNTVLFLTDSTFFDGTKIPRGYKGTRRAFLAERLVKHPNFARAHVNFVWTRLFGRSLTQSAEFDDFGSHNPIVQKEIMDRLALDFVKSGHDPKATLRSICNSDAYALKSVANKTNDKDDKAVYFSRLQSRPLSRHQLIESVIVALTGENYVKRRRELRAEVAAALDRVQSPALSHCDIEPLDEDELSIRRALSMINGDVFNRELNAPDGVVAKVVTKAGGASQKNLDKIVSELYLITLCRPPTEKELKHLSDPRQFALRPGAKQGPASAQFWTSYYQDIFWALLNCNEFALNH